MSKVSLRLALSTAIGLGGALVVLVGWWLYAAISPTVPVGTILLAGVGMSIAIYLLDWVTDRR